MEGGDGMHCLVCKEKVDYEALFFWEEVICSDCEEQIMESDAKQEDYQELISAFRQLWQRKYLHKHNRHFLGSDQI